VRVPHHGTRSAHAALQPCPLTRPHPVYADRAAAQRTSSNYAMLCLLSRVNIKHCRLLLLVKVILLLPASTCALAGANQCLPVTSITAHVIGKLCRFRPSAR